MFSGQATVATDPALVTGQDNSSLCVDGHLRSVDQPLSGVVSWGGTAVVLPGKIGGGG